MKSKAFMFIEIKLGICIKVILQDSLKPSVTIGCVTTLSN